MSDTKPINPKAVTFAWLLPYLIEAARECGYALGLHGSMARDLDLMAMPWVDDAKSPEELVEAIRTTVDGFVFPSGTPGGNWDASKQEFVPVVINNPEHKPHGRLSWSIHFSQKRLYIDLSVMPRIKEQTP